jgi:hypothetical protein
VYIERHCQIHCNPPPILGALQIEAFKKHSAQRNQHDSIYPIRPTWPHLCNVEWQADPNPLGQARANTLQLSKADEEAADEVEVRREDQDKINRFSRLHQRELVIEEELSAKTVRYL